MIKLELKNSRKILRALDRIDYETKRRSLRQGTATAAKVIRDEAKRLVPVDTGSLRQKIGIIRNRARVGGSEVVVGIHSGIVRRTGLEPIVYAMHVEFGTVHQRAQPYMRPAFQNKRGEAISEFQRIVWTNIKALAKGKGLKHGSSGTDNL